MNNKNTTYIFIIITLLFIYLFITRNISSENFNQFKNDINYIFWTGGYDSTFRLCQLLIDDKKIVQPIYISDIIDNIKEKNTRRHNKEFEYNAMKEIRKKLNNDFPFTKKTFLPLIDIKKINIDSDIQQSMHILKDQKRVRRATCQYGGLAQVAKNIRNKTGKKVEICVEREPHGSMMYNTINDKVNCKENICNLKDKLNQYDSSLKIFKDFEFTTLHLSKKDMLNIAKKNNYLDVLKMTWSCWYPQNGKPCGKCIMCRERII
jgi:hypothetical protein